jgi:hypothetical protein
VAALSVPEDKVDLIDATLLIAHGG